ncbi:glycosyl hydrolase family 95 catalytic domain-containing protein [Flavobacterium gilvum]|uniref:Glycosyl hydrolase family 95 N-terminal domain-containing protein n=1 Tax=Flavobacterium gilvum TaxID=1492737 RepID=A0AAC9I331_9FLAO|nr:glycoside hydrolase N-terminal domain-containing protein [Flavobacterium gilvum]AOW08572.1 hypothetical protein EM308_03150 [Flavobacterium gilvum]KFC57909.1 hypothetical protein FEM08_33160 [Flavobacterium gilvum]
MKSLLKIIFLFGAVTAVASLSAQVKKTADKSGNPSRQWIVWSDKPALKWEDAFVTGNGRHGTMFTGNAGEERIICVHEKLFVRAWDRHKVAVANLANLLPEMRKLSDSAKFGEAARLSTGEARKQLDAMGATNMWPLFPHPAFDVQMNVKKVGAVSAYRRELNLETGEAKAQWKDEQGTVEESVFSSRIDNVNVIRIKSSAGKKLELTLNLAETPGRTGKASGFELDKVFLNTSSKAEASGWLSYHAQYSQDPGGYEGLARVVANGGQMRVENNQLKIENTNEVTILVRITPLEFGCTSQEIATRNELSLISADYDKLLLPHASQHGEMFRRVVFDLGCADLWKSTPTEKMLEEAHEKGITPLFLEQMHAMGRYLLISSSGDFPPPLQGIWGGGWTPSWIGGFVMDTNVNLAISGISTGDLAECAESYFGYVERLLPAWRLNASSYLGCRGFLVPHYSDPEKGYLNHFTPGLPWMYWPGGAGWNLMPFYEHGMLYGDMAFLRKRVLPLYQEMAQFYEDYLTKDKDGYYHISPGISPENGVKGQGSTLSKDATFEIAVAREVFDHLLKLGKMFNLDQSDMAKWKEYHDKLVPYRINADGALAEWITLPFEDNYKHRHNSHLYPVFPGREFFEPGADPALVEAARVALGKRFESDTESAHGLIHLALMATRLHEKEKVLANLNRFAQRNYVYNGLVTSHNPEHAIYNLDSVLSLQRLLADMMVFSQPGRVEFLPACAATFPQGHLLGTRIHGGHKLDIQWKDGKLVSATIHAGETNHCTFVYNGKQKEVDLIAGKKYKFDSQFNLIRGK